MTDAPEPGLRIKTASAVRRLGFRRSAAAGAGDRAVEVLDRGIDVAKLALALGAGLAHCGHLARLHHLEEVTPIGGASLTTGLPALEVRTRLLEPRSCNGEALLASGRDRQCGRRLRTHGDSHGLRWRTTGRVRGCAARCRWRRGLFCC